MVNFQRAYILHSRPYQDNKLIVELLTENDGKVAALVYYGQSKKSNKKGLLQPFSPLSVLLKGPSSLKNLSVVEPASASLKMEKIGLYSGLYLNELLVRLLGEQVPCEALFQYYEHTLKVLAQHSALSKEVEIPLRLFETALLDELGLTIDFSSVYELKSTEVVFDHELGFSTLECDQQQKPLHCYNRHHLIAIAEQNFSELAVLTTYKRLTRQIFSVLLGHKPLKSRQLFIKRD